MAKDKNKSAATAIVDENNIDETLNGQVTAPETFEIIKAKIAEEAEKDKQELLKRRYKKACYKNGIALLQRKRDREMGDEVGLYKVRQMTRLMRFLLGTKIDEKTMEYAKTPDDLFKRETLSKDGKSIEIVLSDGKKATFKEGDAMPPIIDVVDFDEMYDKLENALRERQDAVNQRYKKAVQKWDLAFGEYYDSSWRW